MNADVVSVGTADSFLKASSVTPTRRAHQVTAISLYLLLQTAHTKYHEQECASGGTALSLDDWCEEHKSVPQIYYWYTIMQLQLLLLVVLRLICSSNFNQYIDSLSKIIAWFFSVGHTNYAQWLPIHLLQ